MKLVFIGGGSLRILGIGRAIMGVPGLMDGGEICLYDLAPERSEAMGLMLRKTPEGAACGCQIAWNQPLDQTLDGADVVAAILPAGEPKTNALGAAASVKAGFIHSDNLSPLGAMMGVRIGPVLLDLARRMERFCPQAVLLDFVNPVAVMSALVNNHTRIRCFGVCAGFSNHLWDLSRLFGKDEIATGFDGETAGVNHLSYILRGTWHGRDLFAALEEALANHWQQPELQAHWSAVTKGHIRQGLVRLASLYRELGVLVFSTEGDGLAHLLYDEAVASQRQVPTPTAAADLEAAVAQARQARDEQDRRFRDYLTQDLNASFWAEQWRHDLTLRRVDSDIFCQMLAGLGGIRPAKVATSQPNRGVIEGIGDREVVEYTHYLFKDRQWPAGRYRLPSVVRGLTCGLAAHQTLLADAIATNDPRLLARALLAYPMQMFTRNARDFYRELVRIFAPEIAAPLRQADEFLTR